MLHVISAITPPTCAAVWAAAPLCGEPPTKIAWIAPRLASIAYFLPFMWLFHPALLIQGASASSIVLAMLSACLGITAWSWGLAGWGLRRLNLWQRALLFIGGILMVIPSWMTRLIGMGLVGTGLAWALMAGGAALKVEENRT